MSNKKSLALASLGIVVEYYDYALYGFMAPTLAQVFFPKSSISAAFLSVFLVYALSYASKPLGSLILGSIGDRYGRTLSLKVSIFGMGLCTCLMGLLPTYDQVGLMAALSLFVLRFAQGLFVVGEIDGVAIYIYEICGSYKNLANSLIEIGYSLGMFLASLMAVAVVKFDLSWRVPFLVSSIGAVVVLILRHFLMEPPSFIKAALPLKGLLKNHKKALLATILMSGSMGGIYKFVFVFIYPYLEAEKFMSLSGVQINSLILTVSIFVTPVLGFLCDIVGSPKRITLVTPLLLGLCLWAHIMHPIYLPLILLTATVVALYQIPGYPRICAFFPENYRYRGVSFGHSFGSVIFSGSAPLMAILVSQTFHISVFWYAFFLLGVGFLGNLIKK